MHALSARPLKVHGGRGYGECADKSKDFRQPSPVVEGVSHRLTDEVLSLIIKKLFSIVLLREHDGADGIFLFCFALLCKYCRKKYINIAKSLEILSVLYYHIT